MGGGGYFGEAVQNPSKTMKRNQRSQKPLFHRRRPCPQHPSHLKTTRAQIPLPPPLPPPLTRVGCAPQPPPLPHRKYLVADRHLIATESRVTGSDKFAKNKHGGSEQMKPNRYRFQSPNRTNNLSLFDSISKPSTPSLVTHGPKPWGVKAFLQRSRCGMARCSSLPTAQTQPPRQLG